MNPPTTIPSPEEVQAPIPQPTSVKDSIFKILQECSENEQDLLNKLKDFIFLKFPEIPKKLEEKKETEIESNTETKEGGNKYLGKKRKREDKIKEEKEPLISENTESFNKLKDLIEKHQFKNVIKALYKTSLDESNDLDIALQKIIDEIGKDKLVFMLMDIIYNSKNSSNKKKDKDKDKEKEKEKENVISLEEKGKSKEKEKPRKNSRQKIKEGNKPFSIRKNNNRNNSSNNSNNSIDISLSSTKVEEKAQNQNGDNIKINIENKINEIQPEKKDENVNKNNIIPNPPENSNKENEKEKEKENKPDVKLNNIPDNNNNSEKPLDNSNNNLIQRGGSSSRFRKELGLGVHFHKDENDNIYKYCLHHFLGETRAIFYCSDKLCKSIAKYDVDSKDFVVTIPHSKPHAQHNYILNFDTEKKDKIIFLDFQKKDYKEGQVFRKGEGKRIVQWYNC